MNKQELRIGNYVNHNGFAPITIDAVDIIHCQQHPEAYKPIELTEEWLLKLGFIIDNGWFKIGYLKLFPIRDLYYRAIVPITKDIKYVHQLQNLYFALTGEELTIKS